jgi:GntR family transcriptional regulator/MocR family aminotransferase
VTPELGAGFVLLPPALRAAPLELRAADGPTLSGIVQRALAEYLLAGGLRRHTERARRAYRRKRRTVLAGLQDIPGLTVRGMDGGLHAVVEWDDPTVDHERELAVQRQLAGDGIAVGTLSEYWARSARSAVDRPARYGLVIGYAGVPEPALIAAVRALERRLRPDDDGRMGSPAG